jgi:hypothetical protein
MLTRGSYNPDVLTCIAKLTKNEIAFIEAMVRSMPFRAENSDREASDE